MSNYARFEAGDMSRWSSLEYTHPRFSRPVRGKFFRSSGESVVLNFR